MERIFDCGMRTKPSCSARGSFFAPGSQLGRFFPEEKSVRKGNAFVEMGSTGEQVLVSEVSSQHNGWRYVSIIPMAEYAKKTDALRNWLIAAILIVLLVTAFLAFGLAVLDLYADPRHCFDCGKSGTGAG